MKVEPYLSVWIELTVNQRRNAKHLCFHGNESWVHPSEGRQKSNFYMIEKLVASNEKECNDRTNAGSKWRGMPQRIKVELGRILARRRSKVEPQFQNWLHPSMEECKDKTSW